MPGGEKPVPGKLGRQELLRLVDAGEVETVIAAIPDLYGRLLGKRFVARFFLEAVDPHGFHACDYLLACDVEMEPVPGYRFTGWETGYGDFRCIPDEQTLRRAAWLDKTAIVLCDVVGAPTPLGAYAPCGGSMMIWSKNRPPLVI